MTKIKTLSPQVNAQIQQIPGKGAGNSSPSEPKLKGYDAVNLDDIRPPTSSSAFAQNAARRTAAATGTAASTALGPITSVSRPVAMREACGYSVAISPDSRLVAYLDNKNGGRVHLCDISGNRIGSLSGLDDAKCFAFTSDCTHIVSGGADGRIKLWDARNGELVKELCRCTPTTPNGVTGLALSRDGTRLVSYEKDSNRAKLWQLTDTADCVHTWNDAHEIALSLDANRVAVGSRGSVSVYDLARGAQIAALPLKYEVQPYCGADSPKSLVFSPDGERIAVATSQGLFRLFDVETREELICAYPSATDSSTYGKVTGVSYSSDGEYIVTASNSGDLLLWDTKTQSSVQLEKPHWSRNSRGSPDYRSVAFSGDRKHIVAGCIELGCVYGLWRWDLKSAGSPSAQSSGNSSTGKGAKDAGSVPATTATAEPKSAPPKPQTGKTVGAGRDALSTSATTAAQAAEAEEVAPTPTAAERLVKFAKPASEVDATLMRGLVDALHPEMLRALEDAGYTINVARYRISHAESDLDGMSADGPTPFLVDMAEGVHRVWEGDPRITVRSYWSNGELRIDAGTLLHEIGHAYDLLLMATKDGPLNIQPGFAEAFKEEHSKLRSYFHDQAEFAAEAIAYYLLDPERCHRLLPKTFAFLDPHFRDLRPNAGAIAALETKMMGEAVVNVGGNPVKQVRFAEELNRVRAEQGVATQPYLVTLSGSLDYGSGSLARDLARAVHEARAPGVPGYLADEALVRVPAATFNNETELRKLFDAQVTSGRGSLILLDELGSVSPSSPGFAVYEEYASRFGGFLPIVLAGESLDVAKFDKVLLTTTRINFDLKPLEPADVALLVNKLARNDGYVLGEGTLAALEKRNKGGSYTQAKALWQKVKEAQRERVGRLLQATSVSGPTMSEILPLDVTSAALPEQRDPLHELDRMIGLGAVKQTMRQILGQVKLAEVQKQNGMSANPPRCNLLFTGNPGTGKTTVAKLFAEALYGSGYLKSKQVAEVTIQDLLSGGSPEENVKRLFSANKNGCIFVDEFHQLKDTADGKRVFRAMIPYLADKEYANTVFIGAGYPGEIRDLVRDVDPGGERRFVSVPFEDYTKDELGAILDKMVVDAQRTITEEARSAALEQLEQKRRGMKHFGNAGTVETVLQTAIKKQTDRLTKDGAQTPTKESLQALVAGDFASELKFTKESVWAEINALDGLDGVKESLKKICAMVEFAKAANKNPLDYFEPYFIFEGPPGTGKTTVARLLGKLFMAYGLLPSAELVETQGSALLGRYMGQTSGDVAKKFEAAWGGVLFVDEVSGLSSSGGGYKDEAVKEILKQMEDCRGRFVMVVADYPEGINDFLSLDQGLARRFGKRIYFDAMSAEQAATSLGKRLAADGYEVSPSVVQLIASEMAELVVEPNWASGGDVRRLASDIMQCQAMAFGEALELGKSAKPMELLPIAVRLAFAGLVKEKRARGATKNKSHAEDEGRYATATATQKAKETVEKEEAIEAPTAEEQKLLQTLAEVDKQFAAQFNTDPAAQQRQESDVNSDYIKRLAEALGVQPAEALESLAKVKVKVRRLATVEKVTNHFVYWCPYCGGIESPSCAYMGYPLEWKIEHSMKKPWTTTVSETKLVDEEA